MKTLVLTALMGIALSTATANTSNPIPAKDPVGTTAPDSKTEALKAQIALHQWNVDAVWDQYDRAIANIKNKQGSVSDLLSQMNNLIGYYQADINQGIRVADSKEAIAEIRAMYGKKIEKQGKVEAKQIAKLQALLEAELDKEENSFNKLKRTHAAQINEQTKPLVRSAERQFAQSSARIEALKGAMAVAAL